MFTIGGANLVLGIKWLASLDTVQANWSKMFIIFNLDGKGYKLQGVWTEVPTETTLQCFLHVPNEQDMEDTPSKAIHELLASYECIFA